MKYQKLLILICSIICLNLLISCDDRGGNDPVPLPRSTPTNALTENAFAIWVHTEDVDTSAKVNGMITECTTNRITDIFLLAKGTSGVLKTTTLTAVINAAHPAGIKIHAWICVLNDSSASSQGYPMVGTTNWVDARNTSYKNHIINDIITPLCTNYNINGIHLDCIRYPGNAYQYIGGETAITGYCSSIRTVMNNNGKSAIPLTAAIMPESSNDPYYYGQNVANMSPYLGSIQLMTYTHNYGTQPSWVGQQVAYFKNQGATNNCKVWAGIQTMDDVGAYMNTTEMAGCINSAQTNGSTGIICFRYPLTADQWTVIKNYTGKITTAP